MAAKAYMLLVDDEEDILDILKMTLSMRSDMPVECARTSREAIQLIQKNGAPHAVICDHNMREGNGLEVYQFLLKEKIKTPFILCSGRGGHPGKEYEGIYGFVEKPDMIDPILALLDKISAPQSTHSKPEYVPIRLSVLLRLGFVNYDLFMRLGEDKFVKFAHGENEFSPEDARKLLSKKIVSLYLHYEDAEKFLLEFQKNIALLAESDNLVLDELIEYSQESFETTRNLQEAFGWSNEVQDISIKSAQIAVKAVSKDPQLFKRLKSFHQNPDDYVASHSYILTFLCCGIANTLEWSSDYTYMKIAMAALLHDLALTKEQEKNFRALDAASLDPNNKSSAVMAYRIHPQLAQEMLGNLKDLPPDIDKIIMQHHERPDGTGFPANLGHSRINPLSALFIIAHDLSLELRSEKALETVIQEFIESRSNTYNQGYFKKVMHALAMSAHEENS